MIKCLIEAPINKFHDVTPIGTILNRLIHDLEKNILIIWTFDIIEKSFIGLILSIFECYEESPSTLYVSPILVVLGVLLYSYFINSGRDLNRLDGVSRSPAVSLFSETIQGVTTIRTFGTERQQKEKFCNKIDDHLSVMIYKAGGDNWFCIHLDCLSHLYLAFVVFYAITHIDSFNNLVQITILFNFASEMSEQLLETIEQTSKVEKSLISIERCDAFTKIPSENKESKIVNENDALKHWPTKGKIEFKNFSMRYRPTCENALSDINIMINEGEKIGVVGRTGSGKSSLCLSLFRVVEGCNKEGYIKIDDVDIRDISLTKLRRSISIVPQEPFLLEGTLKSNLDPLNIYKKEDIDKVLEDVQLFEMMKNSNKNFDCDINTPVKEYGNNMSFGCRQLLCFARAILRKSKIIILDEATSSVDQKTEEIIQNAVEKEFRDSTVISIAHRIQTVKKCDKIIVMENGHVVEFGNTKDLINNKNSKFYSLYYKNMETTN